MLLRLHAKINQSRANGPGLRAVLWTQGCTLGCPGCFNPRTHPPSGGKESPVSDLVEWLVGSVDIEGLTISGGEPLQQQPALTEFMSEVRGRTNLSVVLFSGYSWEEIQGFSDRRFLELTDILIAGRYDRTLPHGRGLLGSANQSLHFLTPRYSPDDLKDIPPAEVLITRQGEWIISGVGPPAMHEDR